MGLDESLEHIGEFIEIQNRENIKLRILNKALVKALTQIINEGTRCLEQTQTNNIREIYDLNKVDRIARNAIANYEAKR